MSSHKGWIGVDLDGTLAEYDGFKGPGIIGKPIATMVERIKEWLRDGIEVRIFTARVSHDGTPQRVDDAHMARAAIEVWCREHIGRPLRVTNIKDYEMWQLWDDRAVQVLTNAGVSLEEEINAFGNATSALIEQVLACKFRDNHGHKFTNLHAFQELVRVLNDVMDRREEKH